MANHHLRLDPHAINEWAWWYEQDNGINVVVEYRDNEGNYLRTTQFVIPWGQIRDAVKRKDLP